MIAVTGIGVVSPYGVGVDIFRRGMYSHQGLNADTGIDLARHGLKAAGFIRNFSPKKHIPVMKARRMSILSQMGVIASQEAWGMARGDADLSHGERCGVVVGTGLGSVNSTDVFYEGLVLRGPSETNPMLFPETVQNIAAAHISIELGIKGPNTTFSQGDIAGEQALYYAVRLLREGLADAVLVCGVDELSESLLIGMKTLRLLSRSSRLCPFDAERDGMIPAEGASSLVLERKEDAEKRGATIWGLIGGFGLGSDTVERFSYARPDSMELAMEIALKEADEVPQYISASANSTRELDRAEAAAIRNFVGNRIPVTALKSQIGSFMASGIMRTAAALISFREGSIPPVCGLAEPEVAGIDYVLEKPRERNVKSCLINGFSHGGANMCVFVKAPD